MSRPPLPPFTPETAVTKVRMAENAWNTRNPARVALAYTPDSRWRNRADFFEGRDGNENWEFDEAGLMRIRIASINDAPILASERKFTWPLGPRPAGYATLSELGF